MSTKKETDIDDIDEFIIALRSGKKVTNENWSFGEYIVYEGERGVLDEHGQEVNLSVLMNNWNDGRFYILT